MARWLPALASIALLAPAANAAAATPFDLGTGRNPDVAADTNGTGHFVWSSRAQPSDLLHYCQVPQGETACRNAQAFTLPGEALGKVTYVFAPGGNRILLMTFRCCVAESGNYVLTSSDGGFTFSGPVKIGHTAGGAGAQLLGDTAIFGGDIGGNHQAMPLSGPPPDTSAFFPRTVGVIYGATGVSRGSTPVSVVSDGQDGEAWYYGGSGDVNTASNWAGPVPVGDAGGDHSAAGGSAGFVLLTRHFNVSGTQIKARTFNGSGFNEPRRISELGDPIFPSIGAEVPSGRYHAVWDANDQSPEEIRWSTSPDGEQWTPPATLLRGLDVDRAFNYRVSGYNGSGFFTYDSNEVNGPVRAAPLVPLTSGGVPADEVTVGNEVIELFTQGGCITPGRSFTVRVTSRKKREIAGNRGRSRIRVAKFRFNRRTIADTKAAFKGRFNTAGIPPGSILPITATVDLRQILPPKRRYRRTLRGTIQIC